MFINKKKILNSLIDRFSILILNEDIENCRELLINNEYILCYNTIVTQIYEYDKNIIQEEYDIFVYVAKKLRFKAEEYNILKELISK
ncbi:MAG: MafI family immunity protein [Flavobacteriaceae bacterium]|nr:MafI family immunity protein [Flavobacteriaceae bacterium]